MFYHSHKSKAAVIMLTGLLCGTALLTSACGGGSGSGSGASGTSGNSASASDTRRTTVTDYMLPVADGTEVYTSGDVTMDYSNISDGYFMIGYSGSCDHLRLQVVEPGDSTYNFNVLPGDMVSIPLSSGDGSYQVLMFEPVMGNQYALIGSYEFDAQLTDDFAPYLYPNAYAWYTPSGEAVSLAADLSRESTDNIDFVGRVYDYVTSHVTYDHDLAANVPEVYVPDADATLDSGTGICMDYASLMTVMLRSQGIPTKLVAGYNNQVYHAWISVYLDEMGWVDGIIEFNGTSWSLMDPTLAASNDRSDIAQYIGDGSNYTEKYTY